MILFTIMWILAGIWAACYGIKEFGFLSGNEVSLQDILACIWLLLICITLAPIVLTIGLLYILIDKTSGITVYRRNK